MTEATLAVEALPRDFGRISQCLARAFHNDPVSGFLFPNERTRSARLVSLYRLVLEAMSSHGSVWVDPELRGAAIWQAPSPPPTGRLADGFGKLMLVAVMRTATRRALALNRAAAASHPDEEHWYLGILGTDPEHQGKGIASALIRPTLEQCDELGIPAYLESSKPSNIPFYERHGFRVTRPIQVEGGPLLWPMIRR
jgi:ribosomal protein S18 acetylase RimI-like enzyme